MTTRRGFLAAVTAAFALDPERALWVPGAKMISIPAPRIVSGVWHRITPERYDITTGTAMCLEDWCLGERPGGAGWRLTPFQSLPFVIHQQFRSAKILTRRTLAELP